MKIHVTVIGLSNSSIRVPKASWQRGTMRCLRNALLFSAVLFLPTLTLANSFNVSGTIQGGVTAPVNWSGTLTLQGVILVGWNILIPAVQFTNGATVGAIDFTPANSQGVYVFEAGTGSTDEFIVSNVPTGFQILFDWGPLFNPPFTILGSALIPLST
jgi:hypothetical protein